MIARRDPVRAALVLLSTATMLSGRPAPGRPPPELHEVGNDACASCHKAIYDSYSSVAMARTSGPALPNLIEGSFTHAASGVSYRIYRDGPAAFLSYARRGRPALHGTQQLKYSVGSNTRGRTFLFDLDGFLYQSPINYYAASHVWDMSPGYAGLRRMELNHPVDRTCLFCHASQVQPTVAGTVNRYAGAPFLQPGVGCERCHGPGSGHVKGRGPIVNPAKLAPERRDSICMQCHLEGEARITRAGRSLYEYRPGERLADYLAVFVRDDAATEGLGAVSHVEGLALSACKRGSGDAMNCITCHDPHVQPSGPEMAAHYRRKCLGCHAPMAAGHHPRQQDCTACHMPRLASGDITHTMVTDHRIVRFPRANELRPAETRALAQFGNPRPDPRDLGLAYGEVAARGNEPAARESLRLLEGSLPQHGSDPDVLTRLAFLYQMLGDLDRAERFYGRALEADADRGVVAANLGTLYARRGLLDRALVLWREAFEDNPQLSELGLNLAMGLCAAGDVSGARRVVQRVLAHDPDLQAARALLASTMAGRCARDAGDP